ncbi:polymorphic toxin-type HINT domain-containing protein [Saccharopolyspora shandongensis]|uniref:polymorphic toxin-type HINT domain-containing protein n=1 Tax=Saccharopolyspora shandongensis TaxID=418495 RepID=UPI0033DF021E
MATEGHPFWAPDQHRWVEAGELVVGDQLQGPDGTQLQVVSIKTWTALQKVHNLTIDGTHTFYVSAGQTPVLVHNSAGCGTGTVWDDIKATQPNYAVSELPRSFELAAGDIRVWVHGNASEHMAEYLSGMAQRGAAKAQIDMAAQVQLSSLQAAVAEAGRGGLRFDKMLNVGGWELKFGAPRSPGRLPVLFHALPTG